MRKYITWFFLVTLILAACKGGKAPKGIIDHDHMVSLLTDVHIMDGRMYSVKQEPDSLFKFGYGQYNALFKVHHTDTVQFRKSMKYYATSPTEFVAIYDEVLANLKKKLDSINKTSFRQYKNAVPKH